MNPPESDMVTTFPPSSRIFSVVYCATFPEPDTTHTLPLKLVPFTLSISRTKYTHPYPVASGRMSEPPYSIPFPVSTPVNSLRIFLYIPYMYPISRPPTLISPAGTSVFGPMWRCSSIINDWQNRITSVSERPLGSKSDPPLPPPMGSVVSEFLNTCSNARNLRIDRFTVGWNRSPPLYGPMAEFISTRNPRLTMSLPSSVYQGTRNCRARSGSQIALIIGR
mmetsp:Transcript_1104/g.2165  ORF Transcript_1104/g.2165 Transcript_1104/m.2165 type:complete len:222 (-) Transcript_1104:204-869(-)